ncbi:MAG TPA: hypothetical protein VF918_19680 [Anaerolineales bacterium]
MNTRISSLPLKQNALEASKKVSLFQSGVKLMDTMVSMVLAGFVAIFFMWVNGKQHEFDELEDRAK